MQISFEPAQCPVCDECQNSRWAYGKDRQFPDDHHFVYVKCMSCGCIYQNPRIIQESISKYYPDNYSPHKLKKSLPVMVSRIVDWFFSYLHLASRIKRKVKKNSAILDVGCGNGSFLLSLYRSHNISGQGIDISDNAVKSAQQTGMDVTLGTLLSSSFEKNNFDYITMFWYLEHEHYPNEVLKKCHYLLKPSGRVFVAVPNYRSINAFFFKSRWFHLDAPRHLALYSPATISTLLEKHGYRIKKIYHDRSSWGLVGSLQYLLFGKLYNTFFDISSNPILLALLLPITLLVSVFRLSDAIVVEAEKNDF